MRLLPLLGRRRRRIFDRMAIVGGSGLLAAPATPTLTLTTGATDNTPGFQFDGALIELDTVRFHYDTHSDFSAPSEITNAIDAAEDAANQLIFSTGTLADNTWYFRARIERPGHASSAWSNTETETIDTTAPTLSSPTGTKTGTTTASLSVSTNEGNGTLYWVVDTGSTPSAAQVKAGKGSGGSAANGAAGSQAVIATGSQSISGGATGLTGGTTYKVFFMHEDTVGNQSTVGASSTFTTDGITNSETTTWVNAVVADGGTVSAGRQTLVDNLITSLKSAGIWTSLDRLWLFAGENAKSALRDIVSAAAATATNSPTLTADRGYVGNGSNAFIDSGFNPTTAPSPLFVQNSCCMFAWNLINANANTNPLCGRNGGGATFRTYLYPRGATDVFNIKIDTGSGDISAASTDATGLWAVSRPASNSQIAYRNGTSIGSNSSASTAHDNANLSCLKNENELSSTYQAAAYGFGASLDATAQSNLYSALLTYLQAVGAA